MNATKQLWWTFFYWLEGGIFHTVFTNRSVWDWILWRDQQVIFVKICNFGPFLSCVLFVWSAFDVASSCGSKYLVLQSNLWITATEGTGNRWSFLSGGLICEVQKFLWGVVHKPLGALSISAMFWSYVYAALVRRVVLGHNRAKRSLRTRWSLVWSREE